MNDDSRKQVHESVERLQASLESLVLERQELRSAGADAVELERSREAIVRCEQELSAALIARYASRRGERAA